MKRRFAILRNSLGEFKIEPLELGRGSPDFIQIAPATILPGDEKYISQGDDGKLKFDFDRKFKDAKRGLEPAKEKVKREKWNQASVMERIKSSFFKA